jgi:cytidyltransferase-like protein
MVLDEKKILCELYKNEINEIHPTLEQLSCSLGREKEELERIVKELIGLGFVERRDDGFTLTSKGRKRIKVVFIGGTFEIIHYGHIYTIKKAKELGDFLVVVVARDSTVRKRKGRDPVISEEKREELVSSIKYVDTVVKGSETNIYDTLEKVKPDIVALGYDQRHSEREIIEQAKQRGILVEVVRLDSPIPELKTSKLLYES